jgi:hypothetical protein
VKASQAKSQIILRLPFFSYAKIYDDKLLATAANLDLLKEGHVRAKKVFPCDM